MGAKLTKKSIPIINSYIMSIFAIIKSLGRRGDLAPSSLSSKLVNFIMKIDPKKMKGGEGGQVPSLVSYMDKLGRRLTASINCVLSYNINMYIIHT